MSSSNASSNASSRANMTSKLRALALGSKPHIQIELEDERTVYSTLDRLSGKVLISVDSSTRFDDIDIQFTGSVKTYLEKMATTPGISSGTSAFHQFLKLRQPMPDTSYPQPRILEPGRTYEFSFLFVVPQHLLPRVCKHEVQHQSVRDAHLQLPPSLGADSKIDDLAPDMTKIQYQIAARITAHTETESHPASLTSKMKSIRVIPIVAEQPPVNVHGPDSDYVLRAEKKIKKGIFRGKLASLVAEAEQPKSLCLPSSYDAEQTTVSTATTIRLRYDPSEADTSPPRLGSLASKLKVSTWYASGARHGIPKKKDILFDHRQGLHSTSLSLSSRCMGAVEWKYHKEQVDEDDWLLRRDSASSEYPSPSTNYKGHGFYTAEIVVPIALPKGKQFVPTFHGCLVSRTYSLNLNLEIYSAGITSPSIDLKLPIQISAEGVSEEDARARRSLTVEEQQEEQRTLDEFFRPRTASAWTADDVVTTIIQQDSPPEYETFASSRLAGAI